MQVMAAATRALLAVTLAWMTVAAHSAGMAEPPPLWRSVPELWREGPVSPPVTELDPWNYLHRMAMYKALLARTEPAMAALGPNNTGNLLWGLVMQHGWQLASGVNYYLSVIPYLAAMDIGLFGEEWTARPRVAEASEWPEEYCTSAVSCSLAAPTAMAAWRSFFKYVKSADIYEGSHTFTEDRLLGYLWSAHQASLDEALPRFSSRLAFLPGPEAAFGQDWANIVVFVAALQFPTNQNMTHRLQTLLPPRVLRVGDSPPDVADLSPQVNRALQAFSQLRWANEHLGGLLGKVFHDAVCKKEDREEVLQAVQKLLIDDEVNRLAALMLSVYTTAGRGRGQKFRYFQLF